jgi:hypothetical protein
MSGRTTITKKRYTDLVETAARKARIKAREKLDKKFILVEQAMYEGMSEYDYLVARAVETGQSTIYYNGSEISIM